MKKTYTKKQITEAIAYWKKQLETMNEANENSDYLMSRSSICTIIHRIALAFMKKQLKADANSVMNAIAQISMADSTDQALEIEADLCGKNLR